MGSVGTGQPGRTIHDWLYPEETARTEKAPDLRSERVAAIKKKIAEGTYRVSAAALARKLIEAASEGAIEPLG